MPADTPVTPEPLAVDCPGAAKLLGISASHLYAMKAAGKLGPAPIRLGRCRRYSVAELSAWIDAGCPPRAKWKATQRGSWRHSCRTRNGAPRRIARLCRRFVFPFAAFIGIRIFRWLQGCLKISIRFKLFHLCLLIFLQVPSTRALPDPTLRPHFALTTVPDERSSYAATPTIDHNLIRQESWRLHVLSRSAGKDEVAGRAFRRSRILDRSAWRDRATR